MKDLSPKNRITVREVEAALSGFAHDLEARMPDTDEEIMAMFKAIDPAALAQPNVEKFKRIMAMKLQGPRKAAFGAKVGEIIRKLVPKVQSPPTAEFQPIAARKGKKMTPEQRKKIEEIKNAGRQKKK
jgi:hypothetical protein